MTQQARQLILEILSLAEEGETIPDGVFLLGREDLTEEERMYAQQVVEKRAREWHDERAASRLCDEEPPQTSEPVYRGTTTLPRWQPCIFANLRRR